MTAAIIIITPAIVFRKMQIHPGHPPSPSPDAWCFWKTNRAVSNLSFATEPNDSVRRGLMKQPVRIQSLLKYYTRARVCFAFDDKDFEHDWRVLSLSVCPQGGKARVDPCWGRSHITELAKDRKLGGRVAASWLSHFFLQNTMMMMGLSKTINNNLNIHAIHMEPWRSFG